MGNWLRQSLCRLVCPRCDQVDRERLDRAERMHDLSVRAVETAQRKQARRLSDVRVVVDATIQQMDERRRAEEQSR